MNENLNLVEILKDCPKGTKLYSILHGEVEYAGIYDKGSYRVEFEAEDGDIAGVTPDGRYLSYFNGECILFPSKDQRDWSKFKVKKPKFNPKTLNPFDRVLARDADTACWRCGLFSHIINEYIPPTYQCTANWYRYCIPYNDETNYLVGTNEEAPEYYRYWED